MYTPWKRFGPMMRNSNLSTRMVTPRSFANCELSFAPSQVCTAGTMKSPASRPVSNNRTSTVRSRMRNMRLMMLLFGAASAMFNLGPPFRTWSRFLPVNRFIWRLMDLTCNLRARTAKFTRLAPFSL